MRIGLVSHRIMNGDGMARVNLEIAKHAVESGHELVLFAYMIADSLQKQKSVTWVRLPWSRSLSTLAGNFWFAFKSASAISAWRGQLDIVHANGFVTFGSTSINTVHFVHKAWLDSAAHSSRTAKGLKSVYQHLYSTINATLERRVFEESKVLVAVSYLVKDQLLKLGVPAEKIVVIHNGVDPDEFKPGSATDLGLTIPSSATIGLFAGDLRTPRKNLETVLRAVPLVADFHLLVAGRMDDDSYPKLAEQLGVAQRVHFLGYRSDLPALMRSAHLFVLPSRYEACALVLLEALASGLPVITARTAGGAELVTPEAGFVLEDPEDFRLLAEQIAILSSDNRRGQASAAARAIGESYSWSKMAQAYLHLYETERS